jgi:large subunit ribosomal protein L16
MLQLPKKIRYKKNHKGKICGIAWNLGITILCYGDFGIKALERGRVTMKQLEASRRVISNKTKRKAKVWIRAAATVPITKKSKGLRMGKGVGPIKHWVYNIYPGLILFEIDGITSKVAKQLGKIVRSKLPVNTKLISRVL